LTNLKKNYRKIHKETLSKHRVLWFLSKKNSLAAFQYLKIFD
jgi:hypothetical protein